MPKSLLFQRRSVLQKHRELVDVCVIRFYVMYIHMHCYAPIKVNSEATVCRKSPNNTPAPTI